MHGLIMAELRAETGHLQVMMVFIQCSIIYLCLIINNGMN